MHQLIGFLFPLTWSKLCHVHGEANTWNWLDYKDNQNLRKILKVSDLRPKVLVHSKASKTKFSRFQLLTIPTNSEGVGAVFVSPSHSFDILMYVNLQSASGTRYIPVGKGSIMDKKGDQLKRAYFFELRRHDVMYDHKEVKHWDFERNLLQKWSKEHPGLQFDPPSKDQI